MVAITPSNLLAPVRSTAMSGTLVLSLLCHICFSRVFDQDTFDLDGMLLSCIQFGYFMEGQTTVTIGVYIDSTGGAPDAASLRLVQSLDVTTVNAAGQMQVQTVSADTPFEIAFEKSTETLVVMMTTPVMSEGFIKGGGQFNSAVKGTTGETYVGDCAGGFMTYSDYVESNTAIKGYNENAQWYVRLHGTAMTGSRAPTGQPTSNPTSANKKNSNNDDNDSLSAGAIAGISIGVIVGAVVIGAIAYFVFAKKAKSSTSAPLIGDSRI
jgi:hypothetical protein